jgi:hypothetical protein
VDRAGKLRLTHRELDLEAAINRFDRFVTLLHRMESDPAAWDL